MANNPAGLTDPVARMGAEAFTGAATSSLTADITALEWKPANDVADWAPFKAISHERPACCFGTTRLALDGSGRSPPGVEILSEAVY